MFLKEVRPKIIQNIFQTLKFTGKTFSDAKQAISDCRGISDYLVKILTLTDGLFMCSNYLKLMKIAYVKIGLEEVFYTYFSIFCKYLKELEDIVKNDKELMNEPVGDYYDYQPLTFLTLINGDGIFLQEQRPKIIQVIIQKLKDSDKKFSNAKQAISDCGVVYTDAYIPTTKIYFRYCLYLELMKEAHVKKSGDQQESERSEF